MITVSIDINTRAIYTRSAVRIKEPGPKSNMATYKVDDGTILKHNTKDGAEGLAHKLLKLIKEV